MLLKLNLKKIFLQTAKIIVIFAVCNPKIFSAVLQHKIKCPKFLIQEKGSYVSFSILKKQLYIKLSMHDLFFFFKYGQHPFSQNIFFQKLACSNSDNKLHPEKDFCTFFNNKLDMFDAFTARYQVKHLAREFQKNISLLKDPIMLEKLKKDSFERAIATLNFWAFHGKQHLKFKEKSLQKDESIKRMLKNIKRLKEDKKIEENFQEKINLFEEKNKGAFFKIQSTQFFFKHSYESHLLSNYLNKKTDTRKFELNPNYFDKNTTKKIEEYLNALRAAEELLYLTLFHASEYQDQRSNDPNIHWCQYQDHRFDDLCASYQRSILLLSKKIKKGKDFDKTINCLKNIDAFCRQYINFDDCSKNNVLLDEIFLKNFFKEPCKKKFLGSCKKLLQIDFNF